MRQVSINVTDNAPCRYLRYLSLRPRGHLLLLLLLAPPCYSCVYLGVCVIVAHVRSIINHSHQPQSSSRCPGSSDVGSGSAGGLGLVAGLTTPSLGTATLGGGSFGARGET